MEMRPPNKQIPVEVFNLQQTITTLQQRFMALVNQNTSIATFYQSHIVPLFQYRFRSFTEIDQTFQTLSGASDDNQDEAKTCLLAKEANVKDKIYKGYIQVLKLYRIYFLYHFILTHPLSSKIESLPLTHSVASEEKTSPFNLTTAQTLIVSKKIADYQSGVLKTWSETPFKPLPSSFQDQASSLNEKISVFNKKLKELETKEEKIDNPNMLIELLTEEERFARYQEKLDLIAAQQEMLLAKVRQFEEAIDKAMLEQETLHCTTLETAFTVVFDQQDEQQIITTAEIKSVNSSHSTNIHIATEEKTFCVTELSSISTLTKSMEKLEADHQKKNILSHISLTQKISILLNEFIQILKGLLQKKTADLTQYETSIDNLITQLNRKYETTLKEKIQLCKSHITSSFMDLIKPIHKTALSARNEKLSAYTKTLKLQFSIISLDTQLIASLHEKQSKKEVELNKKWTMIVTALVDSFQKEFDELKETLKNENLQTTEESITKVTEFLGRVDVARSALVRTIPDAPLWNANRRKTILDIMTKLTNFITPILQTFDSLTQSKIGFITEIIRPYQARFDAIMSSTDSFYKGIAALQILDREITQFLSEHTIPAEIDITLAQTIKSYLSDENIRKAKVDETVGQYRTRFLKIETQGFDYEELQQLKRTFHNWYQEEQKAVSAEYKDETEKYNHIMQPASIFSKEITTNYPSKQESMPEYNLGWAILLGIIIPILGFYIYDWWYNRQFHSAIAKATQEMCERAQRKRKAPSEASEITMLSAMHVSPSQLAANRTPHAQDAAFNEQKVVYDLYHVKPSPESRALQIAPEHQTQKMT